MSRVCLLLAVAMVASAQTRLAVCNFQSALLETAEIKKAQADLEAKYKPRQAQGERLQKELQDIQQQLQNADKLRPEVAANLQQSGQRKQRELQRLSDDLNADVERDRQDILQRSQQRMQDIIRKLGEEKGVDGVVEAGTMIFFKPALDITKEATAAYDKAHPPK